jgi:uncharacterized protein YcaQ
MAKSKDTREELVISKEQAQRFMVTHHYLQPPRKLKGKEGVLEYFAQVGCIQFDPINVVGRNPDLVLQSRVANYKAEMLNSMLYEDRTLWDGWDKLASIYPTKDFPYFQRFRDRVRERYLKNPDADKIHKAAALVKEAVRQRGPLSSLDIDDKESLQWQWGVQARVARAALEVLYNTGEMGVHRRVNTRRVFDLIENLVPAKILKRGDPNPDNLEHAQWHMLRRVGGLGLADTGTGERWYGIQSLKSPHHMTGAAPERAAILNILLDKGLLQRVRVDGLTKGIFYVRKQDLPTLEAKKARKPGMVILGPLDNFVWDRSLLRRIFDFDYVWEVYKPAHLRKYGYYVLPVMYGEQFVARFDPMFDKQARKFTITNWWWEAGVDKKDEQMLAAVQDGLKAFARYLGTDKILLGEAIAKDRLMKKLTRLD